MNPSQTRVVEAVEAIQAQRDELLELLAAVAAAEGAFIDGKHVVYLPADVMTGIRSQLS